MYNQKEAYRKRKEAGLCVRCGQPSPDSVTCKVCAAKSRRSRDEKKVKGLCAWSKCPCPALPGKRHCKPHHEQRKIQWRAKNEKLKREVMEAYGGVKCWCCPEDRIAFLTLDHMNNDGGKHRELDGPFLYAKLKKLGFPDLDIRVACYNCNCGRAKNDGVCPHHQTQKTSPSNICVPPLKDGFPFCF